jgi:hypothetical protein
MPSGGRLGWWWGRDNDGAGFTIAQCPPDYLCHRANIAHHFVVPKAQNAESRALETIRARRVFRVTRVMLAAIDLNGKHSLQADKIDDVITKRMLPAKFETRKLFPSQKAPHAPLGIGHVVTQAPLQLGAQNIPVGLAFHR